LLTYYSKTKRESEMPLPHSFHITKGTAHDPEWKRFTDNFNKKVEINKKLKE
jgi:hypothetical protein